MRTEVAAGEGASEHPKAPPQPEERSPWYVKYLVLLALVFPILVLFGPSLSPDEALVFRDSGHFYYPLFEWTTREWEQGRVPLWNPLDNLGVSVVGDASSSLFYPGQLVFLLPIDFNSRYKLYIVGHVVLAALTSYALARRLGVTRHAAVMAGIAYSCGGSVVFQHCNVPFLVGAAWLPLAMAAAWTMCTQGTVRSALALGAALSMMILGGDPQCAYHGLLLAALLLIVGRTHWFERANAWDWRTNQWVRATVRATLLLALAGSCMFLLAAVQILPSAEATRTSQRAVYDQPRNIYEAMGRGPVAQGLLGQPPSGTHQSAAYEFSVGPWRLAEFAWPNISGRLYPRHQRWLSLLPAEDRVWTPSLYLGLLPLILALCVFRLRNGDVHVRWLSWSALLFTLGSFGWYGIGFFVREAYASCGGDSSRLGIGSPVGGVYWLMMTTLPYYAQFRYPAKLTIVAALALSQLAAIGWDRAMAMPAVRGQSVLRWLSVMSLLAGIGVAVVTHSFQSEIEHSDPAFGPFDSAGATRALIFSLLHTAAVAAVGSLLLRPGGDIQRRPRSYVAIALLIVDLCVANAWLIPTASTRVLRESPSIGSRPGLKPPGRMYRTEHAHRLPADFAKQSSEIRIEEIAQWVRKKAAPKHHLSRNTGLINSSSSLEQADHMSALHVAREQGLRLSDGSRLPHPNVLEMLGANLIQMSSSEPAAIRRRYPTAGFFPHVFPKTPDYCYMRNVFPRAWIVHRVDQHRPLPPGAPLRDVEQRTREMLFPDGVARDFSRTASLETNLPLGVYGPSPPLQKSESAEITEYHPNRVSLKVSLAEPGLVVVSEAYAPGWIAVNKRTGQTLPILRTNRILRGIWLPAGDHEIDMHYRPQSFYWGAAISIAAWLALPLVWIILLMAPGFDRKAAAVRSSSQML